MSQSISKREKKRTQDRNAQRASRQRTKDRLALLELQVSQLQGNADKVLSDEVQQMRKERSEIRTLTDHLLTIAGAMKTTLDANDDAPMRPTSLAGENTPNSGLVSNIFRDYETLKGVGPTPVLPLSDTNIILNGILNGWDDHVNDDEEPIQRLMAHLHRRFMLERPLARLIDQLGLLYLAQLAFLFLLAQHEGNQYHLAQIPGWLCPLPAQMKTPHNISIDMLPWPQLRMHLLSTQMEAAVTINTEPCESFAVHALRSLYFFPQINFEDAYTIGLDRRLAVSSQFQHYFAPDSVSCPFAVDSKFLSEYPDLRGLIPEFNDFQLSSLSPFSQPSLNLEDRIGPEPTSTRTRPFPSHNKERSPTQSDDASSRPHHPGHPDVATALQDTQPPEDTNSRGHDSPPVHIMAEDVFSNELSEYWNDSLDLLTGRNSAQAWLLSSMNHVNGHDTLGVEAGAVETYASEEQ
ncbi:hypothetical protein BO71DRAFT_450955 [Aspergillus ellipticus CBS 707.79]|uniref:BZIP domain-containing protein n=1 Tax=Aspergillus ellipticus CBS 707.79 TaxID=1448320 RepID=A0A319D7B2_9EURO|nr:hypothetical protein BO71DRAFT_450955 [Aspergillus ellipticus CBS 707.79]